MATPGAETILITVDIKANNERLVELTKQLNENRAALKALADANKAGTLTSDELAAGQVRLKQAAAAIGQETRLLTKANQAQEAANKASTGSIEQLRAQLATGTTAYNALSAAERDNTAAGQQLQATNRATSDQLKVLEGAIGDTRRNVGNYAGSIGPLIQELVKLQEQQKKIPEGTAAYQQAQAKVIGFQQAVNDAGVKAGLTYDQTQAKIAGYGGAIAPVTAKLVQLEAEQKKAGEGSKEYAKIGFQIGAVKKELDKIPESAAKTSDSIKSGFQSAVDKGLAPFKTQVEQSTGLLGKFKSGSDLVSQGLSSLKGAGEEGAGGFKAVAAGIALTGLGVFLLVLSSVISYFTSTAEGGKILKQGLAALGAVVTTVANTFTGAGKALVQAFKDPKTALQDLMGFLKDQVVNRLAAFGVLIDGIRNRDFKKITDSIIQFNLGITNGTDKITGYANGLGKAVVSAGELEAQFQALKKSRAKLEADEILEKGRVEELIRLSKDRTLSAGERLNKLREAGKLESELSGKSIKQITDELNAIKQRNAAKGLSKTADEIQEERDKQKEYNNTVVERNNTLATIKARQSKFILEGRAELLKDQKERVTAAQKAKEDAVKLQQAEVEDKLLSVAKGTQAELELLKQKLDLSAALALTSEKKTAADRKLLLDTVEVEKQKLQADFDLKRIQAAKTEQKREYDENLQLLDEYLDQKRLALEKSLFAGIISEKTYQARLYEQEQAGLAAKLVLAKEYKQGTAAIEKQITATQGAELHKRTAAQQAETAKQLGVASAFGAELGNLFAGSLAETGTTLEAFAGKVLILILDTLEKQVLAQQAAATAASLAQPDSVATFGVTGLARAIAINALITAAFEGAKAAIGNATASKKFATGGIIEGPSHAQGGVPFSVGGRLGFEAEGGEVIISRKAAERPGAMAILSHLNQLGGGAAFATGGLVPGSPARSAPITDGGFVARQMGGQAPLIDYAALAQAMAAVNLQVGVKTITKETARYNAPRNLSTLGG